jgi:bacillithiol synthase
MEFTATSLSYSQTGYFSKIITDYLNQAESLRPFFSYSVSKAGLEQAIVARKQFKTDRNLLVAGLKNQYKDMEVSPEVSHNIALLGSDNCFTVTTAHQPAIFTGNLYFIYKILHTIRLSKYLATTFPANQFVPIFYMGSEDADLEELGKIYLEAEPLVWETSQRGAVGRMQTKGLEKIIQRIEGTYLIQPHGADLLRLLKSCYLNSATVQLATFRLVHALFARFGLVVLIPDREEFKRPLLPIFEDDLFKHTPQTIVKRTTESLAHQYKVQANPRDINLFYLKDDLRGRIEKVESGFKVHDSDLVFTERELKQELQTYPGRFSPNVILRGLMQETILPNVAFIGGGGETAYWLELKDLFNHYQVPFPVLILRNSFLIVEKKWRDKLTKFGLSPAYLFLSEEDLLTKWAKSQSNNTLDLSKEMQEATDFYLRLQGLVQGIDPTLSQFVEALQAKAIKPLKMLEKKMLRAEKRKYVDHGRIIHKMKDGLFPLNNLQERVDNFIPYFAKWGPEFLDRVFEQSLALDQQFVVLEER